MREIKFRAWDKTEMKMIFPTQIIYRDDHVGLIHLSYIGFYDPSEKSEYTDHANRFDLMQFTGLKDKNGKEIYEGDVVTWGWEKAEVEFGTLLEEEDEGKNRTGWICQDCFIDSECEIVGNIYENPELLKNS